MKIAGWCLGGWVAAMVLALVGFAAQAGAANIEVGPYVQSITDSTAVIMWQTYSNMDGTVRYGTSSRNLDLSQASMAPSRDDGYKNVYVERAFLKGLQPDTRYFYQITIPGDQSAVQSFRTHAANPTNYHFLVYGDSRRDDGGLRHPQLVAALLNNEDPLNDPPYFVLLTGDQTEQGRIDPQGIYGNQYKVEFFDPARELMAGIDYIHANGNHDGYKRAWAVTTPYHWQGDGYSNFQPYHSFDRGAVHYVIIDTEQAIASGSAQYNWLRGDLQATGKPFIVAVFHKSPFPASAGRYGTAAADVRAHLVPLFEQYGVSLVVSGHDHYYGHTERNGVHYIIVAGGGADLYSIDTNVVKDAIVVKYERVYHYARVDVSPTGLTLTAKKWDGTVIDSLTLGKATAAPSAAIAVSKTTVEAGVPLTFSGSGSRDTDGQVVKYEWDWGDGSPLSLGATATHAFDRAGAYTVALTVTDNDNLTATETVRITVSVPDTSPPQLALTSLGLAGRLDDASVGQVLVDGSPFPVTSGAFQAAATLAGPSGTASVEVSATDGTGTATRMLRVVW